MCIYNMTQLISQNLFKDKENFGMHVRVKRQYLIDALEHAMSGKVKIAMSEPDKATYITDTETNSFLYECIVMPVRL